VSDTGTIEVRRLIAASVVEVFRWWTEPELLRRWMSPVGSVDATIDLRVGGSFRIVMKDGQVEIAHEGEYLEIDPPRRLVFTWRSRYTDGASLVAVSLEPEGPSATNLAIVHSRLPEAVAPGHQSGWGAMLNRLTQELAS
jgi:uncharacterized protein YndB with AHSA1/START domain